MQEYVQHWLLLLLLYLQQLLYHGCRIMAAVSQ